MYVVGWFALGYVLNICLERYVTYFPVPTAQALFHTEVFHTEIAEFHTEIWRFTLRCSQFTLRYSSCILRFRNFTLSFPIFTLRCQVFTLRFSLSAWVATYLIYLICLIYPGSKNKLNTFNKYIKFNNIFNGIFLMFSSFFEFTKWSWLWPRE